MYALNSLMGVPCSELGAPQAAALYMSSGLFSSLASHFGAWLGLRGKGAGATVGASGAIYGLAAATAALHPDFKVRLVRVCLLGNISRCFGTLWVVMADGCAGHGVGNSLSIGMITPLSFGVLKIRPRYTVVFWLQRTLD